MEIGEYEMKEAINYAVINLLLSHSLTENYFKVQQIFVVIWLINSEDQGRIGDKDKITSQH